MPKGNLGKARESMKLIVVAHKGSWGNFFVCVPGGGGGGLNPPLPPCLSNGANYAGCLLS